MKKLSPRTHKGENSERRPRATPPGFVQTLSFLHQELGQSLDRETAGKHPFYALNEIFRLLAASEHQFFNLMEEKVQERGQAMEDHRNSIGEIQAMKRFVDQHKERLNDVLEIINARGGRLWPHPASSDSKTAGKAEEAAQCLMLTFGQLIRRAKAVSEICKDEVTMLSNDSVVTEAQRSMQQAEGVAKVTFIAFVFVPLSFTTSFFGMNIKELNGTGQKISIWFVVTTPVMIISLLAWYIDRKKRIKAWQGVVSWLAFCFRRKRKEK